MNTSRKFKKIRYALFDLLVSSRIYNIPIGRGYTFLSKFRYLGDLTAGIFVTLPQAAIYTLDLMNLIGSPNFSLIVLEITGVAPSCC
jgi:hypothetical protein